MKLTEEIGLHTINRMWAEVRKYKTDLCKRIHCAMAMSESVTHSPNEDEDDEMRLSTIRVIICKIHLTAIILIQTTGD